MADPEAYVFVMANTSDVTLILKSIANKVWEERMIFINDCEEPFNRFMCSSSNTTAEAETECSRVQSVLEHHANGCIPDIPYQGLKNESSSRYTLGAFQFKHGLNLRMVGEAGAPHRK
jgi:hypothetical protein